jgi:hypothetical protein
MSLPKLISFALFLGLGVAVVAIAYALLEQVRKARNALRRPGEPLARKLGALALVPVLALGLGSILVAFASFSPLAKAFFE